MEKDKAFSSEIVEFSKLVDGVFSEISKDIVELKSKLNESLKEVATLKVSLKKEIEKNKSDSSFTKGKINEIQKVAQTTNKNLKHKMSESMLTKLNERIKIIENKLKI